MHRSIPTPSVSSFRVGPLTIHFYALCIITGIAIAIYWGDKRYRRAGGGQNVVADVAIAAVPAGIIGGRLYHLITSPDAYFGAHGRPLDAFKIWNGGMGIWGAVALGVIVAHWQHERLRRRGRPGLLSFGAFADALAPGLLIAQAIGRFGNWFNGELFGRPTSLPWALKIPLALRPPGYEAYPTFHPTFLYESIWCVFVATLLLLLEKRFHPGQGFLFYIGAYCVGRFFIESLRIDTAHAFAGLRVNEWMSIFVACVAGFFFWRSGIKGDRSEVSDSNW